MEESNLINKPIYDWNNICYNCGKEADNRKSHTRYEKGTLIVTPICKSCNEGYKTNYRDNVGKRKHVYIVVHPKHENWIKLGITTNLESRLRDFNCYCPSRDFKYYYHTSLIENASKFERFFKLYVKGNGFEWFNISPMGAKAIVETLVVLTLRYTHITPTILQTLFVQVKEKALI